jgi:rod shape-determining protein MreD
MHYVSVRGAEPSLVLVAVVWYAIRVNSARAAAYGLIAGLLEDVLATQTGGAYTISTTLIAMLVSVASRGFFADSFTLVATITVVATLVERLVFWVVMAAQGYPRGLATVHLHEALWQSLLNGVLMIAVMAVVRRFDDRYA